MVDYKAPLQGRYEAERLPYGIDFQRLLSGRYEAERLPKDFSPERIVPDFAFNVLNPLGLLYRPVVDEDYLARGGARPVWPEGKPFAVCLTHDVDLVTMHSLRQSSRGRRAVIRKGLAVGSPGRVIRGLVGWGLDVVRAMRRAVAAGSESAVAAEMGHDSSRSPEAGATVLRTSGGAYAAATGAAGRNAAADPLHCFERWLAAEAQVGAKSTFFFWPGWKAIGKHHASDCLYDMEDRVVFDGERCTVAEMIREIDRRGWEIGLHPSWYSFDDVDEMKRQKAALETALGRDVVSARQHYLHYDIRVSPRVQAEAGFKYDATLGFNDNVGFRFGTCYPWRLWDLWGSDATGTAEYSEAGGVKSAAATWVAAATVEGAASNAAGSVGNSPKDADAPPRRADVVSGAAGASEKTVAGEEVIAAAKAVDAATESGKAASSEADAAATQLSLLEIPLIIQDGGLLNPAKGMRLDEETAFLYVKQIASEVERVGGVLTLLWHTNAVANPSWWVLYLRTLEYVCQRGAWCGAVREIGESWKAQGGLGWLV